MKIPCVGICKARVTYRSIGTWGSRVTGNVYDDVHVIIQEKNTYGWMEFAGSRMVVASPYGFTSIGKLLL